MKSVRLNDLDRYHALNTSDIRTDLLKDYEEKRLLRTAGSKWRDDTKMGLNL